jgi:peroxiredoxin
MSLLEESIVYRKNIEGRLGEKVRILDGEIEALRTSGMVRHSAQLGQIAPEFTLPDAHRQEVSLSHLLQKGPVVLCFYRGEWCPFCNLELRAYQQILPEIEALGAALVAISPEKPEFGQVLLDKHKLTFPVVSDAENKVGRAYGLVYQVHQEVKDLSDGVLQLNLADRNGHETWELPIPGTFVIDAQRIIRFAHAGPNFMTGRAEPEEVLKVLQVIV